MPVCPLHSVTPGDVLAAPVHDTRGSLLLPAGRTLTERDLRLCASFGVQMLEVEGEDRGPAPDVTSRERELALEAVSPRFELQDRDHPLIEALLEHAVLQQIRSGGLRQGEDGAGERN